MSDIVIEIFSAESALMRVLKMQDSHKYLKNKDVYQKMIQTIFYESSHKIYKCALDAIAGYIYEEKQDQVIFGFRKFTKYPLQNVKSHRRAIAELMIEKGNYCF